MNEVRPTGITADRTRSLLSVNWSDNHIGQYPFWLLRAGCPCAECRGGHDNMRSDPDPEVFKTPLEDSPATHLRSIEAVGAYAVTIEWEDGHHYGIYNWHYLRALCACEDCQEARNKKAAG
ncbi:MAG: gamma-butyrobetaine hydroxylase-like domain-containing protein [Chloroflexota bacterium]